MEEKCRNVRFTQDILIQDKTIYVDKCPPNDDFIIKYFPDPYVLKYWVKTLVAEEGSNIILKCVYDEQQFPDYKTWYKGENELNQFCIVESFQ